MGILDAPAPSYISPRLSGWHRKLHLGVYDSSIIAVGDSTGDGLTRWVRLLCDKIAAQWPTHTVIYHKWDDPSKTYPSGNNVTVQTGTGPRTIHIYNGSVSGQVVGYAWSSFSALTSGITPDVVFFNYGHNSPQNYDNYRGITHQAVNLFTSNYPSIAVVMTAQNPQAATAPGYAGSLENQRANFDYAVGEGHTVADVTTSFLDYGDYAADLLNADGVHPNDAAGSPRWASVVWDVIRPRMKRTSSSSPASRPSRIWVPATQFSASDGSPTLVTHYGLPMWELDAASLESVVATVDFPSDWYLADVDIIWCIGTDTTVSARTVVWNASYMYMSNKSGETGTFTLGSWTSTGNSSQNANITNGKTSVSTLMQRVGLSSRPVALKVARQGADASDTLPTDALLVGMVIQRMY